MTLWRETTPRTCSHIIGQVILALLASQLLDAFLLISSIAHARIKGFQLPAFKFSLSGPFCSSKYFSDLIFSLRHVPHTNATTQDSHSASSLSFHRQPSCHRCFWGSCSNTRETRKAHRFVCNRRWNSRVAEAGEPSEGVVSEGEHGGPDASKSRQDAGMGHVH